MSRTGFSPLKALLALALALGAAPAPAASDAWEWLLRMAESARTLNYDGTFVYRNGDQIQSMRIIHRVGPDGERERLVSLSGVAREVIRERGRVACVLPGGGRVVSGKTRHASPLLGASPRSIARLGRYYEARAKSGERVAERSTELVVVEPKDAYRYGYRLWLDHESALMLRSELIDSDGTMLEQIVYTMLQLPDEIPDSLLEPGVIGGDVARELVTGDDGRNGGASSEWQVAWLPEGFGLGGHAKLDLPAGRAAVDHFVFSDGLASLSVFIERLEADSQPMQGGSRMGAVNAFGIVVDGHQVTAVGEVPAVTVERVAQSVERHP